MGLRLFCISRLIDKITFSLNTTKAKVRLSTTFLTNSLQDIGFIDDLERYCPALMEDPHQLDNIKSDESRVKRFLRNISEKGEGEVKLNQVSIQK